MKSRHEISEDELMYREMMQEQWHIKPSRKATRILEESIAKVLKELGVDTDKDAESIKMQMEFLGIFIRSISKDDLPNAAGLYINATIRGELVPYATIAPAEVKNGSYRFKTIYWQKDKLDEGKEEKL